MDFSTGNLSWKGESKLCIELIFHFVFVKKHVFLSGRTILFVICFSFWLDDTYSFLCIMSYVVIWYTFVLLIDITKYELSVRTEGALVYFIISKTGRLIYIYIYKMVSYSYIIYVFFSYYKYIYIYIYIMFSYSYIYLSI